jgi:chromosome partitioning protein
MISQKGGTGKSTLLVGLAVEAARRGYDVAVIDIDPQASAAKWKDRREAENPAVVSAQASRLKQTLDAARSSEVDYAFIDTQGRLDDASLSAVRASDLVFIPTQPTMVEIETLPQVKDIIRLGGSPAHFVLLNGIHPTAGVKAVADIQIAINDMFGFECCPVHVSRLNAYSDAITSGTGPQEAEPDGRAASELQRLFDFVENLAKGASEHVVEDRRHSKAT